MGGILWCMESIEIRFRPTPCPWAGGGEAKDAPSDPVVGWQGEFLVHPRIFALVAKVDSHLHTP